MGWIRKHMFLYEHHRLYIEPTEEEKIIRDTEYRRLKQRGGLLLSMSTILASMNNARGK